MMSSFLPSSGIQVRLFSVPSAPKLACAHYVLQFCVASGSTWLHEFYYTRCACCAPRFRALGYSAVE